MNAAAALANPDPVSSPVPPPPLITLEKVAIRLPRMWIGYVMAAFCLLIEIPRWLNKGSSSGDLATAALLGNFFGWIYWLFCVHRMHKVLARATHSSYQTTPRRAIWLQFVPLYNLIWAVKWPNRIARFLKQANPAMRIAVRWPGILILLGGFFGYTSFRLFVLFSVGVYLNRKIRGMVEFTKTAPVAQRGQLDLAVSAGLGAGFGLLLCRAMETFLTKSGPEQLRELAGILIVSLGIVKFVEPLAEWVRHAFHTERHSSIVPLKKSWFFRGAIFLAVVFSSFSHQLLDSAINDNMWSSVRAVAAMLVVSGGITYAWIAGARRHPARASTLGLLSGGSLSLLLVLVLWVAFDGQVAQAQTSVTQTVLQDVGVVVPWVDGSRIGSTSSVTLLLWAVLGLAGGIVIDRKWGGGSTRNIALSVLITALVAVVVLRFSHLGKPEEIALGVSSVLGWCLSLLIYPSAEKLFKAQEAAETLSTVAAPL
jgi:hypothetical protein